MVEQIASLLNIGLDKETLSICVRLIENDISPSALALGIVRLQRDAAALAASQAATGASTSSSGK